MSGFGVSALSAAWLFLLLGPLVLFYFLKLRRPRMTVPSLVLWRRVVNDSRVNSPFQRFKRNILLLLQILLLMVVVLAAMQPFIRTGPRDRDRIPILIDCSASMAARERLGGPTRLDEAKTRVGAQIDTLLRGQQMSIVTFSGRARKVIGFTDNRRLLREALRTIAVEDVESELEDALRVAQALGRVEPFQEVLLYSDGNLPAEANFDLPFELHYERIPAGGANVGITALNAARGGDQQWAVFVQIEGAGEAASATVEIYEGEQLVDERIVAPEAGAPERLSFRVDAESPTAIEVRLKPDGFDALLADNRAWLSLPALRPLDVFVSPDLPGFRHALRTQRGLTIHPATSESVSVPRTYDLVIAGNPDDAARDTAVLLTAGFVPQALADRVTVDESGTAVVDWQRNAALLQHVNLADLVIMDGVRLAEGVGNGDIEADEHAILVHGTHGPLLLRKIEPGTRRYHLLFDPGRSTLPYRVGFPVMVANAIRISLMQQQMHEIRGSRTGVLPDVLLTPDVTCTVRGPDGSEQEVQTDAVGRLAGVRADLAGPYEVRGPSGLEQRTGAAVLSPLETSLVGVETLDFGELSVDAAQAPIETDRPLWPMLALLGFGLLMVEWAWFQRQFGGFA